MAPLRLNRITSILFHDRSCERLGSWLAPTSGHVDRSIYSVKINGVSIVHCDLATLLQSAAETHAPYACWLPPHLSPIIPLRLAKKHVPSSSSSSPAHRTRVPHRTDPIRVLGSKGRRGADIRGGARDPRSSERACSCATRETSGHASRRIVPRAVKDHAGAPFVFRRATRSITFLGKTSRL